MHAALEIKNVTHKFGEFKALDKVSININPGDFTVLLGLNGAGKTTLYSLITRLYNNNTGSIKIHNFNVRENSSNALKNIGVVFQQPTLDLDLSVEENLHYHSALHGVSTVDASSRISEEIGRIDLNDKLKSKVRSLSGGQRRRVEIARSIALNPKFIMLDEPFAGIDPLAIDDIKNLILKLNEKGLGILISDHNVKATIDICENVKVISSGKIIADGSAAEITDSPLVKKVYLGESF